MKIACIVVAGGKATRMGPWAPKLKPYLGVGPWDPVKKEGNGPCCLWRALTNLILSSNGTADMFVSLGADYAGEELPLEVVPALGAPVTILRDKTASPLLGPLQALTEYVGAGQGSYQDGVVLHNADDLIHRGSVAMFFNSGMVGRYGRPVLLATHHEQRGYFGMLTAANTVDEKPVLARGWIGAGLIYLPPDIVDYALNHGIHNVSVLINRLYDNEGIVTRVVRSPHPWATVGNPEQYLKACEDPTWR